MGSGPRAYTLGGYLIALTTFGPFLCGLLDTSDWNDSRRGRGATILAFLLAAGYLRLTSTAATPMSGKGDIRPSST